MLVYFIEGNRGMTNLTKIDSDKSLVAADDSFFLSKASICNPSHLRYCDCQSVLVNQLYSKKEEEAIEEAKRVCAERNIVYSKFNPIVATKLESAKSKAIEAVGLYLATRGVHCPVERQAIKEVMSRFSVKRDLSDPEVFSILESLINMKLNVVRYQSISDTDGIYAVSWDRDGNPHTHISELEKLKLEYEKAIIDAVTKLNKMVEGDKSTVVSINLSDNIKEVWERRKKLLDEDKEVSDEVIIDG